MSRYQVSAYVYNQAPTLRISERLLTTGEMIWTANVYCSAGVGVAGVGVAGVEVLWSNLPKRRDGSIRQDAKDLAAQLLASLGQTRPNGQ